MIATRGSNRNRSLRPVLLSLEDRALLNATMPHKLDKPDRVAHVIDVKVLKVHDAREKGPTITVDGRVSARRLYFTNFDGPTPGTNAGAGTNHERHLELRHLRRVYNRQQRELP